VEARWSATKSMMVTSDSCPMALMTGVLALNTASATMRSLNAQRSSMLPPPRVTIMASMPSSSARRSTAAMACATAGAAASPCTGTPTTRMSTNGARSRAVFRTSWSASAWKLVITATRRGKAGSGRRRSARNQPFSSSSRRSAS
jgi:hypothetical protein